MLTYLSTYVSKVYLKETKILIVLSIFQKDEYSKNKKKCSSASYRSVNDMINCICSSMCFRLSLDKTLKHNLKM